MKQCPGPRGSGRDLLCPGHGLPLRDRRQPDGGDKRSGDVVFAFNTVCTYPHFCFELCFLRSPALSSSFSFLCLSLQSLALTPHFLPPSLPLPLVVCLSFLLYTFLAEHTNTHRSSLTSAGLTRSTTRRSSSPSCHSCLPRRPASALSALNLSPASARWVAIAPEPDCVGLLQKVFLKVSSPLGPAPAFPNGYS